MKNNKYGINENIIKNYVKTMNSITVPMSQIKEELNKYKNMNKEISNSLESINAIDKSVSSSSTEYLKNIFTMNEVMGQILKSFPKEQMTVATDMIRNIMNENNGVIYTRMIEPLNISRQCLSILEKNGEIEKIGRGMYIRNDTIQDDYYFFQQKYKKTIFSHMNALYFHGMTEELPYVFTVTVPNGYHDDTVNEKCNVFYVDEKYYELGLCEVKTSNGNIVRAYDIDRCICDIIRSKSRMDFEQVKKSIREYIKRKDKNMLNLSKYAKEMNITEEVMEMVGMYYE